MISDSGQAGTKVPFFTYSMVGIRFWQYDR